MSRGKLTADDAWYIRQHAKRKGVEPDPKMNLICDMTQAELAEKFGVAVRNIGLCLAGSSHPDPERGYPFVEPPGYGRWRKSAEERAAKKATKPKKEKKAKAAKPKKAKATKAAKPKKAKATKAAKPKKAKATKAAKPKKEKKGKVPVRTDAYLAWKEKKEAAATTSA